MAVNSWPLPTALEASYTDTELQKVALPRVAGAGRTSIYPGVRPGGSANDGFAVTAAGSPNNTVTVVPGVAVTPAANGAYESMNDANQILTVPAAHATLLRKDAVVLDPASATVTDRLFYVVGTPGGGSYPTATGTQYKIANVDTRSIAVAGGTVIRTADIFNVGGYTASPGGRIICTSSTRPATPYEGLEIWETDTDLILTWNGTVWRSASTMQVATSTTRPASPANGQTIFETDSGLVRVWRSDQSRWQAVGGDAPMARFTRGTNASLASGTWVTVQWDGTITNDPGGLYTFVTVGDPGRIRFHIAGVYLIEVGSDWEGTGSNREFQVRRNSANSISGGTKEFQNNVSAVPIGNTQHASSKLCFMNAGDYIEVFVKHNDSSSKNYYSSEDTFCSALFMRDLV